MGTHTLAMMRTTSEPKDGLESDMSLSLKFSLLQYYTPAVFALAAVDASLLRQIAKNEQSRRDVSLQVIPRTFVESQ